MQPYPPYPTPHTDVRQRRRMNERDEEYQEKQSFCSTISHAFWWILLVTLLFLGGGVGILVDGLLEQQKCRQDYTLPNRGITQYQDCRDRAWVLILIGCALGGVFILMTFVSCCAFMDVLCFRRCRRVPPKRRHSRNAPMPMQMAHTMDPYHQQTYAMMHTQQPIPPQILSQQQPQGRLEPIVPIADTHRTLPYHRHPESLPTQSTPIQLRAPQSQVPQSAGTAFQCNHPQPRVILHEPQGAPTTLGNLLASTPARNTQSTPEGSRSSRSELSRGSSSFIHPIPSAPVQPAASPISSQPTAVSRPPGAAPGGLILPPDVPPRPIRTTYST